MRDAMRDYGRGDNSVTDRLYYEDASRLCLELARLPDVAPQADGAAIIEANLPEVVVGTEQGAALSRAIACRLESLQAPLGSRIGIEAVRQIFEQNMPID